MASQGPNSPGTLADDGSVGSTAWSNPTNAAASDDSRATCGGVSGPSHYLKATNFGFSIPSSATIVGIEVSIERSAASASPAVTDNRVNLVLAGTIQSYNNADPDQWPTSDAAEIHGGATDLWNQVGLTPADINDSGFGCALSANMANNTARVDHITITVYYVEPTGAALGGAVAAATAARSVAAGAALVAGGLLAGSGLMARVEPGAIVGGGVLAAEGLHGAVQDGRTAAGAIPSAAPLLAITGDGRTVAAAVVASADPLLSSAAVGAVLGVGPTAASGSQGIERTGYAVASASVYDTARIVVGWALGLGSGHSPSPTLQSNATAAILGGGPAAGQASSTSIATAAVVGCGILSGGGVHGAFGDGQARGNAPLLAGSAALTVSALGSVGGEGLVAADARALIRAAGDTRGGGLGAGTALASIVAAGAAMGSGHDAGSPALLLTAGPAIVALPTASGPGSLLLTGGGAVVAGANPAAVQGDQSLAQVIGVGTIASSGPVSGTAILTVSAAALAGGAALNAGEWRTLTFGRVQTGQVFQPHVEAGRGGRSLR